MEQHRFAINIGNEIPVGINTAGLTRDAEAMLESIARRAYQIFEDQGRKHGHDREHWFQAEAELFKLPPIEMEVSPDEVTVLAQVSGFARGELEVDLEPRRVTIVGKHQTVVTRQDDGHTLGMQNTQQLFKRLDLPVNIDVHHVRAHLKRGILELDMKKALAASDNKSKPVSVSHTV